ncbi:MAG: hypothetical protein M1827_005216 [Pycnora praestabilis]|nr:MAG: hypothetical protein M1827_005216 [Pycnora praestabilis]
MSDFNFDANATSFPKRHELPHVEGTPEGAAWFWGKDDFIGRLNLLTPTRVVAASKEIRTGEVVPLNLPLDVPKVPSFGREQFQHEIKVLHPGVAYDDIYHLNTQSGTQWDGFRHFSHMATNTFYNNTKEDDIMGPKANHKCSIHHWAEHGIVGRGILLDYRSYAKKHGNNYEPASHHPISYAELSACGKEQGIDIRPEAEGGDIKIGDILFIRSGFVETYWEKSEAERVAMAERPHRIGKADEQKYVGVGQEEKNIDWMHDCYFAAVVGDAPSFEAWPSMEDYYLHEYLLARWGCPIGEMWDLEKLAETCRAKGRWTFFVTSSPANVPGGVSSHGNAMAVF